MHISMYNVQCHMAMFDSQIIISSRLFIANYYNTSLAPVIGGFICSFHIFLRQEHHHEQLSVVI